MSLKSLRTPLRHTAVAVVTASAICLPATSAFADSSTEPAPRTANKTAPEDELPDGIELTNTKPAPKTANKTAPELPDGIELSSTQPGVRGSEVKVKTPRGGVAAGEKPAATSADGTTAAVGTAAGALLLAGAGTLVIRRRAAARHDG
ncbi:sortase-dependent protein [Streptomyces tubercidicus]